MFHRYTEIFGPVDGGVKLITIDKFNFILSQISVYSYTFMLSAQKKQQIFSYIQHLKMTLDNLKRMQS
jgi:hypothetical protein